MLILALIALAIIIITNFVLHLIDHSQTRKDYKAMIINHRKSYHIKNKDRNL